MLVQKMIIQRKILVNKIDEKNPGEKGRSKIHLKNYSLHLIRVKSDWPGFYYLNFGWEQKKIWSTKCWVRQILVWMNFWSNRFLVKKFSIKNFLWSKCFLVELIIFRNFFLPSSAKTQLNWAELALILLSPTIQHPPNKIYFTANMYVTYM